MPFVFGPRVGASFQNVAILHLSTAKQLNVSFDGYVCCAAIIVIIAIVILAALFLIQQFGTKFVGSLFSPVIVVWFVFNIVVGLYNIIMFRPEIFKAFGPNYWFAFFLHNQKGGWQALGGVVLCITGANKCVLRKHPYHCVSDSSSVPHWNILHGVSDWSAPLRWPCCAHGRLH